MSDSMRSFSNIFSTITFLFILILFISSDSIISNISLNPSSANIVHGISHHHHLQVHKSSRLLHSTPADADVVLRLFEESHVEAGRLDSEITEFFTRNRCETHLFMTWISTAESFGKREFLGLESLFKSNPKSCLIILSATIHQSKILQPLIEAGFRVRAISPDLSSLFKNTPAERWMNEIKNGSKSPGEIPLPQNLSNLIRLAVLYKHGGVYLDTDFIILKDLSSLRNSIGAQSVDVNGKWTRLNNAILVFDKNHELVHEFMEEFASTFDGNRWGYNGPYLVTRVVDRVARKGGLNFTILPPMAFYPVHWNRIPSFFARPNDLAEQRWVKAKLRQLSLDAYGVHLWNRQSSGLEVEEGSIIRSLLDENCVLCRS